LQAPDQSFSRDHRRRPFPQVTGASADRRDRDAQRGSGGGGSSAPARGTVAHVRSVAADALLSLLSPAWQALIAFCLLIITILGLMRLAARGRARMTTAVLVTGGLIVVITLLGTLAVSCSGPESRQATTDLK
jgi:hypothetical protein